MTLGTISRTNSSNFGATSTFNEVTPVILPLGRLRLATSPAATGSAAISKTIGIDLVAAGGAVLPDRRQLLPEEGSPCWITLGQRETGENAKQSQTP